MDFAERIKGMKKIDAGAYPPFHVFDSPGEFIEGVLSEPREIDGEYGKTRVMTLTLDDGTKESIGLSAQLSGLWGMVGKRVIIRYNGEQRNASGKGRTKQFEVYE